MLDIPYNAGLYTRDDIGQILKKLCALGPRFAAVTGVSFEDSRLGAAALDSLTGEVYYAFGGRENGRFHGTGDIFASTLLACLLGDIALPNALDIAVQYTHRCIVLTEQAGLERRYGVCFEKALPWLVRRLGLDELDN